MESQKIFVAIAGNIGTGKTTLAQLLSERLRWNPHFESVSDNPYLEDFYQDMARWSFPLQIHFLNHRFNAHQKIVEENQSAIQDRTIYEDANIFARNLYEQGLMAKRDYLNYLDIYRSMCRFLAPPDLLIYLKSSVGDLKKRIQKRGREYEKDIPEGYLESLNHYYNDWMDHYREGRKLIIDRDQADFVDNPDHLEQVVRQILDSLEQQDLFYSLHMKLA